MLLHEHPVNIERERAGRSPANSVWFSCGGTMPPRPPVARGFECTFAAAGIAAALAAHAGIAGARAARPSRRRARGCRRRGVDRGRARTCARRRRRSSQHGPRRRGPRSPAAAFASVTLLADDRGRRRRLARAPRPAIWQRVAGRHQRHDLAALLARRDAGTTDGHRPPRRSACRARRWRPRACTRCSRASSRRAASRRRRSSTTGSRRCRRSRR